MVDGTGRTKVVYRRNLVRGRPAILLAIDHLIGLPEVLYRSKDNRLPTPSKASQTSPESEGEIFFDVRIYLNSF